MPFDFKPLETQIPLSLRKDQHRFRRTLDKLKADQKAGRDIAKPLDDLQTRLAESVNARKARANWNTPVTCPFLSAGAIFSRRFWITKW